jgi:7-carboxy-7-deazaguanine synthase (Cx14CxxC type)
LWSGREQDRANAICQFCDTDFVGTDGDGGGKFLTAAALAEAAEAKWGQGDAERFIVLTGGEPMLQVDAALIDALHARGFFIAIESNGTLPVPRTIDWICISPKAGSTVVQTSGNELKLVWPQSGSNWQAMQDWSFDHFLIQPMDNPQRDENVRAVIAFVIAHPNWRLTLQTHKIMGIA